VRTAAALLLAATPLLGQNQQPPPNTVTPPAAPAVQSRPTPFHVELGGFYSALSRGYGDWRGADFRMLYASRRATPFIGFSTQSRAEGAQQNVGIGSYIRINDRAYSIVGVSHAPDHGVVLYPKTRFDLALLGSVGFIPGLVAFSGFTKVYGNHGSGGQSFSIGSFYYHGHAIATGAISFNRDRLSGAGSHSQQAGIQYGAQGSYWIGGSVSHGTEAYQVVTANPFEARFEGAGASAFAQRWISRNRGLMLRYEFEHKYTAYVRHGFSVTYFFDF
jgi:YaiO family outer membrane protein